MTTYDSQDDRANKLLDDVRFETAIRLGSRVGMTSPQIAEFLRQEFGRSVTSAAVRAKTMRMGLKMKGGY